MQVESTSNAPSGRLFLLFTLFSLVYWGSGLFYNPYNLKLTGIIFELLWLPMILWLFIAPVFCSIKIGSGKENTRYYKLTLILVLAILSILLFK
jgi:hypothetical protein